MDLEQGTRLGPYEIATQIGEGGMGQVYRGTDTRLGRAVAIKVLPDHLASREDLRTRFDREAKAVSQLNHPHICTLHDVGEASVNGTNVHYLVMELLDGETLADRISRGPMPLDQVLCFGMQVADALDRAHRSGIVHRDLKPGNIMITAAGVKLLDFGLAKTLRSPSLDSNSPTLQAVTGDNVIVGTLQYMAPEQLTAGTIDARSDIFAFGVVLYEMMTGRHAFNGVTQASVIAAIIHEIPAPVSTVRAVSPSSLDRVIAMCMAKDPEERWQNARDVMLQLRAVGSAEAATTHRVQPTRPLLIVAALLGGILIGAIATALLRGIAPAPKVSRVRHVAIDLVPPLPLVPNGFGAPFDIAPDGSKIAWVGIENSAPMLFVRRMDSLEIRRIAGSEGASSPFFSPDGESIAFFGNGVLRVVSLAADRRVTEIAIVGPGSGGGWLDAQTIVAGSLPGGGISRARVTGGRIEELTTVDSAHGEAGHSWPCVIPGTNTFLFTVERDGRPWEEAQIMAYSVDTKQKRVVLEGGTRPRYASGRLYFTRGNQLLSVAFDPKKMEVAGSPSVVIDGVVSQPGTGGSFFAVASDGTVVYLRGTADFFATRVITRTPTGTLGTLDMPPRTFANPRLSHDGNQLAVQVVSANDDVWVYHRLRHTFTRVTAQAENLFPNWAPDDASFMVSSFINGKLPIIVNVPVAGSSQPRPLAPEVGLVQIGTSWSPSGRVAFTVLGGSTGSDIYLIESPGARARPFLQTRFSEHEASLSPDGRFIAYTSDESGSSEIYLRVVDSPAQKLQLSIAGGREPLWSRDGRRVYFRDVKGMLAVDITPGGAMPAGGAPRRLFDADFIEGTEAIGYDVGPDGTFVMLQRNGTVQDGARLQVMFAE